jgi:Zn finger protein HypA/HybF involved in hydrogenase expression
MAEDPVEEFRWKVKCEKCTLVFISTPLPLDVARMSVSYFRQNEKMKMIQKCPACNGTMYATLVITSEKENNG